MKILVTGAGGFVGGHLLRLLVEHGHEVSTLGQGMPKRFSGLGPHVELDILDKESVKTALKKLLPEAVIHLAALSNVPYCWRMPEKAISVNVCGMLHVLEAFANVMPGGTLLNIGSSDAYGLAAKVGRLIREEDVCMPQNPYAISKYCSEMLALQLGRKLGVKVIHTRSFNHFGPGQALGFVVSDFASQIAEIEAGKKEPVLLVGDLSAARDFTYVGDVVAAYAALIEKDVPEGVYNICSGKIRTMQQVLDCMINFSKVNVEVRKDSARVRSAEVSFFAGDNRKIWQETGWNPKVSFEDGLLATLEYWRERQ